MSPHDAAATAVALVACAFDLHRQRIPNALTFGAAALALLAALVTGGFPALGASAAGWIVGVALFLPVYALGGMGAGDVKLLAAIGACLGPDGVFNAAVYTAIAGGALAVMVAVARGCLRQTCANVGMLLLHWRVAGITASPQLTLETSTSPKLAYAVPTLIGTVTAIWLR
jgi:prepilin peptidase CpaA